MTRPFGMNLISLTLNEPGKAGEEEQAGRYPTRIIHDFWWCHYRWYEARAIRRVDEAFAREQAIEAETTGKAVAKGSGEWRNSQITVTNVSDYL